MGNLNIIAGASFPASIPKVGMIDGMESAGSLLLIEPGHSSAPWSGLPANKTEVPNILKAAADKLIGRTTKQPTFVWASRQDAAARVERTKKGGLNVVNTPTATVYSDAIANVPFPDDIADYVAANFEHRFFASMWLRTTLPKDASLAADAVSVLNIQSDPVFGLSINSSALRYVSNYSEPRNFAEKVGSYRLNAEYNSLKSFDGRTAPFSKQLAVALGNSTLGAVSQAGKSGSYVFYRMYLEDLTVSGRSYAQLNDLDAGLYAQAFGAGGRYYGDTFTNPI